MIGSHACYQPGKDLVIPVFAPPQKWSASPWLYQDKLTSDQAFRTHDVINRKRPTLAYFSGNLAHNEPFKCDCLAYNRTCTKYVVLTSDLV